MAIMRYEPWSLLSQLQKELERSRDDKSGEGTVSTAEWAPAVDIREDAESLLFLPIFLVLNRKRLKSAWKPES